MKVSSRVIRGTSLLALTFALVGTWWTHTSRSGFRNQPPKPAQTGILAGVILITNAPPREYDPSSFREALTQKLNPKEIPLVIDPLTSSPELENWARAQTVGATNDIQKSRMLYDAL